MQIATKFTATLLTLLIFNATRFDVLDSRIENTTRNASTGAIESVYERISENNVFTSISQFPGIFSYADDLKQVKTTLFDAQNQRIILAEGAAENKASRSLMAAKIESLNGEQIVKLTSLASPSSSLKDKQFLQIEQTDDKIIAVTTDQRDRFYIADKTNPDGATGFVVQDNNSTPTSGVIDYIAVANNKIIVAMFQGATMLQGAKDSYDNNQYGCIKVYDTAGSKIGDAKHSQTGDTLLMNTYEPFSGSNYGASALTSLCGPKNLTRIGAMHWDADLQRLFIAFSRHDGASTSKFAMPFLVARFSGNDLVVEPLTPLGFEESIVTFKLTSDSDDYYISGLTTTTDLSGHKYLVVGISYGNNTLTNNIKTISQQNSTRRIFAIPLLSSTETTNPALVGRLANKNFSAAAAQQNDFYYASTTSDVASIQALVGGARLPVSDAIQITDIKAVGHTILVSTTCCRNDSDSTFKPQEGGIWASTALFDEGGNIAGWSSWYKLSGNQRGVYAMHFDPSDGQLWLVQSAQDTSSRTINNSTSINPYARACQVAKTTFADGHISKTDGGLASLATTGAGIASPLVSATHFPAVQTKGIGALNLSVLGYAKMQSQSDDSHTSKTPAKLVLVSTGRAWGTTGSNDHLEPYRVLSHGFDQTTDVLTSSAKTNIITLPETEIAPTCACIATLPNQTNSSWLCIGTSNGIAIFSKGATSTSNDSGDGFETTTTPGLHVLNNLDLFKAPIADGSNELTNNFYWRKLTGISEYILDICATPSTATQKSSTEFYLYALTTKNLYRITMTRNHLKKYSPTTLSPVAIFNAPMNTRVISLHLLQDSNAGLLMTTNPPETDPTLPSFMQNTQPRNVKLWLINNIDQAIGIQNFVDVSNCLGSINNITSAKLINANTFNATVSFDPTNTVLANLVVTTGSFNNPASQVYVIPIYGTLTKDPFSLTGLTKNYGSNIYRVGAAQLVSDLYQTTLDKKLCLGSNLLGIAYSYGTKHCWQQQANSALRRLHVVPLENSIAQENIRICNAWIDSATGANIIAGNFGFKIQE